MIERHEPDSYLCGNEGLTALGSTPLSVKSAVSSVAEMRQTPMSTFDTLSGMNRVHTGTGIVA
jgi:hypothetical protein